MKISQIIGDLAHPSIYRDRQYQGTDLQYHQDIQRSTTLYIGNLSFYSTEEQLYHYFKQFGIVKRVIIGLDRNSKTPCGFAFVEFYTKDAAIACKRHVEAFKLDDRFIRADWDYGFQEGRQYGRGRSGGQVRDEFREDYDAGRGGWGILKQRQQQQRESGDGTLHYGTDVQGTKRRASRDPEDDDGNGMVVEDSLQGKASSHKRQAVQVNSSVVSQDDSVQSMGSAREARFNEEQEPEA